MRVSKDLLRDICPLGVPVDSAEQSFRWIGTCFLIGALDGKQNESGEPTYKSWLVTSRHLLKDRSAIVVGFNSQQSLKALCFPIHLDGKTGWHSFPETDVLYGKVDIAVIPLQYEFLQENGISLPSLKLNSQIADNDEIIEGQPILVIGYPLGFSGDRLEEDVPDQPYRFSPIVRYGIISRVPWVHNDPSGAFLIDAMDSPGNSGGPIILAYMRVLKGDEDAMREQTQRILAGVVRGYIPDSLSVTNADGQPISLNDDSGQAHRLVVRQNSGLAKVEKAEHIAKLIESYPHEKIGISWTEYKELTLP